MLVKQNFLCFNPHKKQLDYELKVKCNGKKLFVVGKGGHTSPPPTPTFSRSTPLFQDPPFLEIQDVPTFHRSIRKTKVLNNSCNQFVNHLYPQSILVLEECSQKW